MLLLFLAADIVGRSNDYRSGAAGRIAEILVEASAGVALEVAVYISMLGIVAFYV